MPVIVGGVLAIVGCTVIENPGSAVDTLPSVTRITMLPYEPTSAARGVPLSMPVEALKLAQGG